MFDAVTKFLRRPKLVKEHNPAKALAGLTTGDNIPLPEIWYVKNLDTAYYGFYIYKTPKTSEAGILHNAVKRIDFNTTGVIVVFDNKVTSSEIPIQRVLAHEWRHHYQKFFLNLDLKTVNNWGIEEDAYAWENAVDPKGECQFEKVYMRKPKLWQDQQRILLDRSPVDTISLYMNTLKSFNTIEIKSV